MSLATNVSDLATAVATEVKRNRTFINGNALNLDALNTTAKTNLVAAINELEASIGAASGIDDGSVSTTSTWSSSKIDSEIDAAIATVDPTDLINDTTPSTTTVYSSTKTEAEIAEAVAALVASAPGALDTLDELAAALGDDANFATTVNTALGNRVRYDAAQTLTSPQQAQARTNIGAASAADLSTLTTNVGDTATNFVTTFEAGLV